MTHRVPAERVRAQIVSILAAWGMPADLVEITAGAMVETDLWGVDSHGVSMLMLYEQMKQDGRLRVDGRPKLVRETPVLGIVDGGAGLGHPVGSMGMELAVEKALASGVGVVTAHNSHHFGAAGVYAKIAVERGCVALVTSTARGITVVPTFGAEPVLGTNPIAFGAPAKRNPPFLLDFATSAVAVNKVKVYSYYDKPIPEGWVNDADGAPVRDAAAAFALLSAGGGGGLNPIGGSRDLGSHKGYGLALVAQILGGALAGGSFSPVRNQRQGPREPYNIGHFFLAIDPKAFGAEGDFEAHLDEVIDVLHGTRPAEPGQPVLVAGEPEAVTRERRLVEGIPIPDGLADGISALAGRAGVPFLLSEPVV